MSRNRPPERRTYSTGGGAGSRLMMCSVSSCADRARRDLALQPHERRVVAAVEAEVQRRCRLLRRLAGNAWRVRCRDRAASRRTRPCRPRRSARSSRRACRSSSRSARRRRRRRSTSRRPASTVLRRATAARDLRRRADRRRRRTRELRLRVARDVLGVNRPMRPAPMSVKRIMDGLSGLGRSAGAPAPSISNA